MILTLYMSFLLSYIDSSGMAMFILFDLEAKKLLNISARDLLNKCLEVRIWKVTLLFNI